MSSDEEAPLREDDIAAAVRGDDVAAAVRGDDVVAAVRDDDVATAVTVLAAGGIVAYPTETVYGLGVDARNPKAIADLIELKGRDEGRGISVLVTGLDMARVLLADLPTPDAVALAARWWPGPLTIVLPAAHSVAAALCGPSGGIGLRCSSDPWATALVKRLGAPITSTSANRSGDEPARSSAEVKAALPRLFVLDGGQRRGTEVSTVVEFSKGRATLRRVGAIRAESISSLISLSED